MANLQKKMEKKRVKSKTTKNTSPKNRNDGRGISLKRKNSEKNSMVFEEKNMGRLFKQKESKLKSEHDEFETLNKSTNDNYFIGLTISYPLFGEKHSADVVIPREEFQNIQLSRLQSNAENQDDINRTNLVLLFNHFANGEPENYRIIEVLKDFIATYPMVIEIMERCPNKSVGMLFHLHGTTHDWVSVTELDFNDWCRMTNKFEYMDSELLFNLPTNNHVNFFKAQRVDVKKHQDLTVTIYLNINSNTTTDRILFEIEMDDFEKVVIFSHKERLFDEDKKLCYHTGLFELFNHEQFFSDVIREITINYACQFESIREAFENDLKNENLYFEMSVYEENPELTSIQQNIITTNN